MDSRTILPPLVYNSSLSHSFRDSAQDTEARPFQMIIEQRFVLVFNNRRIIVTLIGITKLCHFIFEFFLLLGLIIFLVVIAFLTS